ncbi:hypothetical protein JKP88DRAFT_286965 [Tribonema minus]|uniref:Uncharacterized protein n=1 Tax=Tribonema minus TaxID=303371 RepID=A0A835Z8Y4_9STRA|nr:hypothetical protein JKP88DRAFT_286965 [Tribonema minus]
MNAAKTALLSWVRQHVSDPSDQHSVRKAIADFVEQSDNGIKASTWAKYVSEVHLFLAEADDPLHEHFSCPQLRTGRSLAWRTDLAAKVARGPYRHDLAKLYQILAMCKQGVETLNMSGDMLSIAVQVVSGARHVEVVSPIHQWTLLDDGFGVHYIATVKAKHFSPEGKAEAAETPKIRISKTLLPGHLVLRALKKVRHDAKPGDTTAKCQARIISAICPRVRGGAPRVAGGQHPLLRELIDGYNGWYGLAGHKKKKLGIFRQIFNCFEVMEGAIPDTAYRLVRPLAAPIPQSTEEESGEGSESDTEVEMDAEGPLEAGDAAPEPDAAEEPVLGKRKDVPTSTELLEGTRRLRARCDEKTAALKREEGELLKRLEAVRAMLVVAEADVERLDTAVKSFEALCATTFSF